MENTRHVIENARTKVAMLVAAGAIILGASGCTGPDEESERQADAAAVAEAAPRYTLNEGADSLPLVADELTRNPLTEYDTLVDNSALASEAELQESQEIAEEGGYDWRKGTDVYVGVSNIDPATMKLPREQWVVHDKMPSKNSAPSLDFMINSAGKLVYKDMTPGTGLSQNELHVIRAANNVSPILTGAMRGNDVNTLHVRVHEPATSTIDYEFPTESSAQYISKDFNDDGKKSIYYFLENDGYEDEKTLEQILSHEASHGMTGQREYDGSNYTAEERKFFSEACGTIRESALKTITENSSNIIYLIEDMRSMVDKKYRPVYDKVIKALQDGTYAKLPNSSDTSAIPECYTQNPWSAFKAMVSKKEKDGWYETHIAAGVDLGYYEKRMQEMIDTYNDMLAQDEVQQAINEATYLDPSDEKLKKWGHTNEGADETNASTTGLLLNVPEAFGKNVGLLPPEQKQAVLKITDHNVQKIAATHLHDKELQKFIADQQAVFLTAAGEVK